jgi:hypothetical protein
VGFIAAWLFKESREIRNYSFKTPLIISIVLIVAAFILKYFDVTITLGQITSTTTSYTSTLAALLSRASWDLVLVGGILGSISAIGMWQRSHSSTDSHS